MLPFQRRYDSIVKLGVRLHDLLDNSSEGEFKQLVQLQHVYNPWFIESFIIQSLNDWSVRLAKENLETFIAKYPVLRESRQEKNVAVISEENIPFTGFHDMVCILLAGHHFYCRNVNHQCDLLKYITSQLICIEPDFTSYIHWSESFSKDIDSYLFFFKSNETTRRGYFEKKHSLIRQKRFSVGVITEDTKREDIKSLGHDIFTYFGLSSYNIRKLFVPHNFAFQNLFESLEDFAWLYSHNRYANNHDYHQSVFLMEQLPFLDNGFIILRESVEHDVPVGCLYYEYYNSNEELKTRLEDLSPYIQNVSAVYSSNFPRAVKPGSLHQFQLWDFEDYKDVVQFLVS